MKQNQRSIMKEREQFKLKMRGTGRTKFHFALLDKSVKKFEVNHQPRKAP